MILDIFRFLVSRICHRCLLFSYGFPLSLSVARSRGNKSVVQTPLGTVRKRNIAVVTPGPNINNPICVMRRPAPGETAISLCGSPLLVSTDNSSSMANISVPVDDRVFSIFPRDGFLPEDVPQLDHRTVDQLNMLRRYLNNIVSADRCDQ